MNKPKEVAIHSCQITGSPILTACSNYYCIEHVGLNILKHACNEANFIYCLSPVYSVTIPLYVSGLLVAHHQEVTM
jgi:hypothetical protein